MVDKHRSRKSLVWEFLNLFISEIAITSHLFCQTKSFAKLTFFPFLLIEVEATYEKALGEEEERIVYQRKMLLLSTKKIRERENEMLIRGKNCLLRKRVEASENELELMLRNLDKQVKFQAILRLICFSPLISLHWNICKVGSNVFELQINKDWNSTI